MATDDVPLAPQADVAVVIVNYNAGDYLARCVESVFESSGGLRVDVLVVDNASHDGSARLATERAPQTRLIENPTNQGLSALTNYLLAAPASAVAFGNLDGDSGPDAAIRLVGAAAPARWFGNP